MGSYEPSTTRHKDAAGRVVPHRLLGLAHRPSEAADVLDGHAFVCCGQAKLCRNSHRPVALGFQSRGWLLLCGGGQFKTRVGVDR